MTMPAKKKLSFEQSMDRLEEIVLLLEKGEEPLERSLTLFEEGAGLLRSCSGLLENAEQKVKLLVANADGEPVEDEFPE